MSKQQASKTPIWNIDFASPQYELAVETDPTCNIKFNYTADHRIKHITLGYLKVIKSYKAMAALRDKHGLAENRQPVISLENMTTSKGLNEMSVDNQLLMLKLNMDIELMELITLISMTRKRELALFKTRHQAIHKMVKLRCIINGDATFTGMQKGLIEYMDQ